MTDKIKINAKLFKNSWKGRSLVIFFIHLLPKFSFDGIRTSPEGKLQYT